MIEVYANDTLIYTPGVPELGLLGLKATTGVEKAGTASITMPPGHPAYDAFVSYRTQVTIHRLGKLIFRGRAFYPSDDFYNRRTITCEGERCFLRDGTMRPYVYQAAPADIFADVIALYNAQVDDFKQFRLGSVTVADANDYIRIESDTACQVSDVVDKLVELCGGYIVFTTDTDGVRCINWLASLDRQSGQSIEFGSNLLDYTSTGANTDLATAIVPLGARNEKTGKYLTIESVNNGQDFIQDDEAVALRGFISRPVVWDDVTKPENLLTKARQYLENSRLVITSLELSAVDLSALNRDIDSFSVGDWVQVRSAPHGVDAAFLLRSRTYNLLDPAEDTVIFGMDAATLTGSTVSAANKAANSLNKAAQSIKSEIAATGSAVSESIRTEMSETYGMWKGRAKMSVTVDLPAIAADKTVHIDTGIPGDSVYEIVSVDGMFDAGDGAWMNLHYSNDASVNYQVRTAVMNVGTAGVNMQLRLVTGSSRTIAGGHATIVYTLGTI